MVEDESVCNMYRDKVSLRQKVTRRRVRLPNGRSFLVRYERVSRKNLLSNVTVRRNRTVGLRRQRKHKIQPHCELLGNALSLVKNLLTSGALTKGLSMGSKGLNSELGKKLIDKI